MISVSDVTTKLDIQPILGLSKKEGETLELTVVEQEEEQCICRIGGSEWY